MLRPEFGAAKDFQISLSGKQPRESWIQSALGGMKPLKIICCEQVAIACNHLSLGI